MSDNPAQQGPPPGGITGAIKGMFTGTGARGMTAPAPIKTPIGRQDSLPELVGTPSDIGIWETSHDLKSESGKFTWKRLFQDPKTYRKDLQPSSPPAPTPK